MSLNREPVEITPPHGDAIRADVRWRDGDEPRTAVLMAHGFKGFKDWGFFPHLAESLARDGHAVVSFNFSLNGTGAGPNLVHFTDLEAFGRNTVSRELEDLHWMIDWSLGGGWRGGRPLDALGLFGHSRGGGAAIVAAAEDRRVSALATWSAVASFNRWSDEHMRDWRTRGVTWVENARTGQRMPLHRALWDDLRENARRLDVLAAAARVLSPWLVVHGEDDLTVPLEEGERLAGACPAATLKSVGGSGHAFEATHPFASSTPGLDDAVGATRDHFGANLAADGQPPGATRAAGRSLGRA